MKKINLKKSSGPIVFVGCTNALPVMYALELKKAGFKVLLLVDADKDNYLHRPENHYPQIKYPYPDWIIEFKLPTQILVPYFRVATIKYIETIISQYGQPQLIVLNSLFISLAPLLTKKFDVVSLTHGSDMSNWGNVQNANIFAESISSYSVFKFLPLAVTKRLVITAILRQIKGFEASKAVISFPYGFDKTYDQVIDYLKSKDVNLYYRYDVSFSRLTNQNRGFKAPGDKLIIFSGVRFNFNIKRNDIMIKGLGKYYKTNKDITIHLVEKGVDLSKAKALIKELGLENAIIWHKEMKFLDLIELYKSADICFGQLGDLWIAAIGAFALWLGKPLIANDEPLVRLGIWPQDNPICSAANEDEVCYWLTRLENTEVRNKISLESKRFVEDSMSPSKLINNLFKFA